MKVDIVIPTWNRQAKLDRCLESIERQEYPQEKIRVHAIQDTARLFAFGVWNRFLATWDDGDAFLYLCDDTELFPDCVSASVAMLEEFCGDAVIGLNQSNIPNSEKCAPCAMALCGRKFVDRFPNRQVFCPDYSRFWADVEVGDYMKQTGLGQYCAAAKLVHYHPSFFRNEMDSTHHAVRDQKQVEKDKETYRIRKERGLTWGMNHDLVNA